MLASLTSKLYTVDSLREIADRMGITVPSKARKADIAALIVAGIEDAHAEYVDSMNTIESDFAFLDEWERELIADAHAPSIAEIDDVYLSHLPIMRRIDKYMIQRGYNCRKLTAAQWRRVRRYGKRNGVTIGIRNDGVIEVF